MNKIPTLKGGALIYTLMIALIISGLMSGFLLIQHYSHRLQNRLYFEKLAEDNLRSGAVVYLNQSAQRVDQQAFALFNSEADSCYIRTEPWGLFTLLHGKGTHGRVSFTQSALIGEIPQGIWTAALYLADKRQPLTLVGNTELKGQLVIPAAGLRTGYIGKTGYFAKGSLQQSQSRSSKAIPKLDTEALNMADEYLSRLSNSDGEYRLLTDLYERRAWDTTAFILRTTGSLIVQDCQLNGKTILVAPGEIIVESSSSLAHTLLFAKRIRIKKGFQGKMQAFATERLIVESGVHLDYPSVLCLSKQKDTPAKLQFANQSEIQGGIFYLSEGQPIHREDQCQISGSIWGTVYASHHLDLRANVAGHVFTGGIRLKTPAAIYTNYLLDAQIDAKGLAPSYVGPCLTKGGDMAIIQWFPQTSTGL